MMKNIQKINTSLYLLYTCTSLFLWFICDFVHVHLFCFCILGIYIWWEKCISLLLFFNFFFLFLFFLLLDYFAFFQVSVIVCWIVQIKCLVFALKAKDCETLFGSFSLFSSSHFFLVLLLFLHVVVLILLVDVFSFLLFVFVYGLCLVGPSTSVKHSFGTYFILYHIFGKFSLILPFFCLNLQYQQPFHSS